MINKIKELYLKYKEIINYLIIGVLTTLVSLGVYYALVLTVLDPLDPIQLQIANVVSWICAVTFAYLTNRKIVFESQEKNMWKEGAKFYASRGLTLLLDMGFMFLFVTVLHMNDKVAKIIVQFLITASNYVISKFFVFKKKRNNND